MPHKRFDRRRLRQVIYMLVATVTAGLITSAPAWAGPYGWMWE